MKNAIIVKDLNKTYRSSGKSPQKKALEDINLEIPKGSFFGLLGPNGAGKSTLINIMGGLVIKTSGKMIIEDCDIDGDAIEARRRIGIVGQEISFDPFFTPWQILDIQAGLFGVPKKQRRTDELLEMVGLKDKARAWARQLSGGMKRRLMVAKAMVHNPDILVLDEPTAGVDIELRQQLWENVTTLNKAGKTILLTTHYLEEAEKLCDKIAIINHGNIVACEDKETLLARIEGKEMHFKLDRDLKEVPINLKVLASRLVAPNRLAIAYSPKETTATDLISAVQKAGLGIVDISTTESDLEDVFLQITRAG